MSDPVPTIRILAFGASLIEGTVFTSRGGLTFHPCTVELHRLLTERFPGHRIEIMNYGMAGDFARDMPWRLEKVLASDNAFDVAFFLGGTNDVGEAMRQINENESADDVGVEVGNAVANAIESMVAAVQEIGADAVCMSLPEHGLEFNTNFDFRHSSIARNVICNRLSTLAERSPACAFLDLGAAIPFQSPEQYFCDTIHFNVKGYDLMGAKLFEIIAPLLEKRLTAKNREKTSTAPTQN
jgi:lysophospholipase L1-like esterase